MAEDVNTQVATRLISAPIPEPTFTTFGAVLQELLFWYKAKTKLDTEEYKAILTSTRYWIVVTAMAIGSGIAAYVWFTPE